MPQTFYTEEEYRRVEDMKNTAIGLARQIAEGAKKRIQTQAGGSTIGEKYVYIPVNFDSAIRALIGLREHFTRNQIDYYGMGFLEVGCGVPFVSKLAQHVLRCHTAGIEIDKNAIGESINIFGKDDKAVKSIIETDAFKFRDYSKYDIIYYYCPLFNDAKEIELENAIEDEMKVGAYLMPFLKKGDRISKDNRFERIEINEDGYEFKVWKKVKG